LTNYFPHMNFNLFLVGPENSAFNHEQTVKKNNRLQGKIIKNTI